MAGARLEPSSPAARRMLWAVLLLLLAVGADRWRNHLSRTPGIDFYQYWAVPKARAEAPGVLGSPYSDQEGYARVLAQIADAAGDRRLAAVTEYRRDPGFASTPLVYVLGSWLPSGYSSALALYQGLHLLALLGGWWLLARNLEFRTLDATLLAAVTVIFHMPVLAELRVLNTNAFQLAALAGACRLLRESTLLARSASLCLVIFVAFLKPVWALLVPLWFLLAARRGGREATRAGAVGVAFAAACVLWPALEFGFGVWPDWFGHVLGSGSGAIDYAVSDGNRSTLVWLAETLGWSRELSAVVVAAVLGTVLVGAVLRAATRGRSWRDLVGELAAAPERVMGAAIVVSLALSPLAWWHYQVLALMPLATLWSVTASRVQAVLGWTAFLLASGRLGPVFAFFIDPEAATAAAATLAWLPLWIGLLLPWAGEARQRHTLQPEGEGLPAGP